MNRNRLVWDLVALIVAATLAAVPAQARPQPGTYEWTSSCEGWPGTWSWAWMRDGVVIAGTQASVYCSGSGKGNRPASADGFTANATVSFCLWVDPGQGGGHCLGYFNHTWTWTASFDASKNFAWTGSYKFDSFAGSGSGKLAIKSWPA